MRRPLTRRALGRATLARQLLLERATARPARGRPPPGRPAGPGPARSRTSPCGRASPASTPTATGRLVESRALVRTVVMRATIHLVTADDCLLLRPLFQPVLEGELRRHRDHAPRLRDVDLAPVLTRAAALLAEEPRPPAALGRALEAEFPSLDGAAMAYAARNFLALVQVPPRGVWRRRGQVSVTTAESWLGRPLATAPAVEDAVERYLAAFGPARPADLATWSRLTGFREILDGMGARAAGVPRRPGPGALRRARRAAARRGRAGAGAVPARVRQRRAVPRRPQPLHARRHRRPRHRWTGARHGARGRVARGDVVDGRRGRPASR